MRNIRVRAVSSSESIIHKHITELGERGTELVNSGLVRLDLHL